MVRKIKKVRVHGYCRFPRPKFKIWFDIRYVPISTISMKKKEREKVRNINNQIMIKMSLVKARELNEYYDFPRDEEMVILIINGIKIKI